MDETPLCQELLTAFVIFLYAILFIYIYANVWLVWYYGHKRWCFRTAVLFTSLIWTALRIVLFMYYWSSKHSSSHEDFPQISQHVDMLAYFILFSFPLYLQFTVLCLFIGYFSQILSIPERLDNVERFCYAKRRKILIISCNVFLLLVNLVCAILIKKHQDIISPGADNPANGLAGFTIAVACVIYIRVFVNALMFIIFSIILAFLIRKVSSTQEAKMLLETERLSKKGAIRVGILLSTLYSLRTVANVLALIPSITWVYDTDQVDLLSDKDHGYYMFLSVLLIWEYLPTLASIVFFRAKRPKPHFFLGDASYLIDDMEDDTLIEDFGSCSLVLGTNEADVGFSAPISPPTTRRDDCTPLVF